MSYKARIGQSLARYGLTPREPHIVCDDCGLIRYLATRDEYMAEWFLRDQAVPDGWRLMRADPDGTRIDLCPVCKELV